MYRIRRPRHQPREFDTSKTCCIGRKMCWYGITSVIKEFFKACMLFVFYFVYICFTPLFGVFIHDRYSRYRQQVFDVAV